MSSGTWPPAMKRFLWDLLPKTMAPGNDGLEAPETVVSQDVQALVAFGDAETVEQARRVHDMTREISQTAEEKASRLVTLSITLLGLSLALLRYQLQELALTALSASLIGWIILLGTLAPALLAIGFFGLAGISAFDVDRVGLFQFGNLGELAKERQKRLDNQAGESQLHSILYLEEKGRQLADWTGKNKLSTLMQGRAWFSRGLVAIFVGAVVAISLSLGVNPERLASCLGGS